MEETNREVEKKGADVVEMCRGEEDREMKMERANV